MSSAHRYIADSVLPLRWSGFSKQAPVESRLITLYNSYNCLKLKRKKEDKKMENLWLVLFWSGPIGLGIFLALLGTFAWLLAKANEINKRTKREERKKD
jgi:hypothetical protein